MELGETPSFSQNDMVGHFGRSFARGCAVANDMLRDTGGWLDWQAGMAAGELEEEEARHLHCLSPPSRGFIGQLLFAAAAVLETVAVVAFLAGTRARVEEPHSRFALLVMGGMDGRGKQTMHHSQHEKSNTAREETAQTRARGMAAFN